MRTCKMMGHHRSPGMQRQATAFLIDGYLGAGKATLVSRPEVEQAAIRFTQGDGQKAPRGEGLAGRT